MQPIVPERSIKVFISYAHTDQALCKKLQDHLSPLIRSGRMTIWQDQEIPAGENWEDHINTRLNDADVILLLVSASFIASNYCWNKEVREALERHKAGMVQVIPIILKPVHWQDTPLGQLQALPTGTKPVTQWNDLDTAFDDVVRGIRKALGRIDKPSGGPPSPIVVTSKLLDVDYMETVGQDGRRVLVPASGHIVRLTVQATDSRTTILQDLCPIVVSRSEATGSLSLHFGIVTPRPFEVLLDERPPCLRPINPAGPKFPFTIGPGDPEVFDLKVLTSTGDVQWRLELSWTCLGQEGTLPVDLGGSPFRTMARPKKESVS
jgi:hypothetical protein